MHPYVSKVHLMGEKGEGFNFFSVALLQKQGFFGGGERWFLSFMFFLGDTFLKFLVHPGCCRTDISKNVFFCKLYYIFEKCFFSWAGRLPSSFPYPSAFKQRVHLSSQTRGRKGGEIYFFKWAKKILDERNFLSGRKEREMRDRNSNAAEIFVYYHNIWCRNQRGTRIGKKKKVSVYFYQKGENPAAQHVREGERENKCHHHHFWGVPSPPPPKSHLVVLLLLLPLHDATRLMNGRLRTLKRKKEKKINCDPQSKEGLTPPPSHPNPLPLPQIRPPPPRHHHRHPFEGRSTEDNLMMTPSPPSPPFHHRRQVLNIGREPQTHIETHSLIRGRGGGEDPKAKC